REFKRIVFDELERDRTNEGSEYAAGPAQHCDEDEIARGDPEGEFRGHMADEVGDKSAAKATNGPGDDVGPQDRMVCGRAEIFNTDFVVAHRLHEVAERRGEKSRADIYHGSSEHEHEVVLYEGRMRRRRARESETSNTEPIGPAREIVELDQHCVEDHRQR